MCSSNAGDHMYLGSAECLSVVHTGAMLVPLFDVDC